MTQHTLTNLLALPEVSPDDLSATNGGIRGDYLLRTPAQTRQVRAFDFVLEMADLERAYSRYQIEIARSDTHVRRLGPIDCKAHIAAITSGNPTSAPLTYLRPRRERGMRRLFGWMGVTR